MSLRDWMHNHPAVQTTATVVVLLACLGALLFQFRSDSSSARTDQHYYLDTVSGDLFAAPVSSIPPIKAPSDDPDNNEYSGIRARVFSCSDPKDESTHFIGFLETHTPKAKSLLEKAASGGDVGPEIIYATGDGKLVRLPDEKRWVPVTSPQGSMFYAIVTKQCGGGSSEECYP